MQMPNFKPLTAEKRKQLERPLGGNPGGPTELFKTVKDRLDKEAAAKLLQLKTK